MIDGIECLIDLCIADESHKPKWKRGMEFYKKGMDIVKRKGELAQPQVLEFQKYMDIFFQEWVNLYADQGVTNYIHYLGAGHIAEYLLHWKNISDHSQQGWEAFNNAFKSYYYNRTQRGGAVNKGKGERSRLKPMARWLQRRMVFMLDHTKESIEQGIEEFDEAKQKELAEWVQKHGGTVEYGVSNELDFDANEDGEFLMDWEMGPTSLNMEVSSDDDDDEDVEHSDKSST